jgi:hypothetical protein
MKLVLGWPGIPDDWCWQNQNESSSSGSDSPPSCARGEGSAEERDWGSPIAEAIGPTVDDVVAPPSINSCSPPPGAKSASCCLRGAENPDLRHLAAANASDCCAPCVADADCVRRPPAPHPPIPPAPPSLCAPRAAQDGLPGVMACTRCCCVQVGFTFNAPEKKCFLKKATGHCTPATECVSAVVAGRKPSPAPAPPPYPGPLTCGTHPYPTALLLLMLRV